MTVNKNSALDRDAVAELCRMYGSSKKTGGEHTGQIWVKVNGELVRADTK